MLIISRKKGEQLHIGRDITIKILDVRSGKVRIGIDAPAECRVSRDNPKESDSQNSFEHKEPASDR